MEPRYRHQATQRTRWQAAANPPAPNFAKLAGEAARQRPVEDKRAIFASMKQHAPEVVQLLKAFPGSTVISWRENGELIGVDYEIEVKTRYGRK